MEPHLPQIDPVVDGTGRPRWSVMIPTYNCARYLPESIASVLSQDPGSSEMQIEVVDDCSTDADVESLVRELGRGRIAFHRQPQNVGHCANFNSCIRRARGHLVHILHSDDVVLPGFYRQMEKAFAVSNIGLAFCRHYFMNDSGARSRMSSLEQPESGPMASALQRLARACIIQASSAVVRRNVYEESGGFDESVRICGEDWEMWVRIAAVHGVWYEPQPLACYREHALSLNSRNIATGANIRDVLRSIGLFARHLPHNGRRALQREARRSTAMWALGDAATLLRARELESAINQAVAALECSRAPIVVVHAALTIARCKILQWGRAHT